MASRQRCDAPSRPVSRSEGGAGKLSRHAPWRCGTLLFVSDAHSPAREWASFISVEFEFFIVFQNSGKNQKLKKSPKNILAVYSRFFSIFLSLQSLL